MFKIADGREYFYQWDLDRQIIVEDPTITEVHFCNRTDDCSLVVEVEDLEIFADFKPISVLRTANVPNVILQKSFDVRVFGYDGKATRYDEVFKVKARTKPTDYVYTETEIYTIEEHLARAIDEAKANGEFNGEKGEKGDKGDPGEPGPQGPQGPKGDTPDLTGYATEKYVDDAIANIDIPEGGSTDLSNYYTKEETDELISDINQCNTYFFNAEAVEWQSRGHTPAPASLAEFAQRLLAGEAVNLCVAQIVDGNVRWLAAEFAIANVNDVLSVEFVQGISVTDIGKEDSLQIYRVYPEATVDWAVAKTQSFSKFIADKTYVDTAIQNAFSGIAQAEGGAY